MIDGDRYAKLLNDEYNIETRKQIEHASFESTRSIQNGFVRIVQIIHCTFTFLRRPGLFIILTFELDIDIIETYFFTIFSPARKREEIVRKTLSARAEGDKAEVLWCVRGEVCFFGYSFREKSAENHVQKNRNNYWQSSGVDATKEKIGNYPSFYMYYSLCL